MWSEYFRVDAENNKHVIEMSCQLRTGDERATRKTISSRSTNQIFPGWYIKCLCMELLIYKSFSGFPELSTKRSCCIVFILATLCYISSLEGGFVFDDTEAIINNGDVRSETPITQLFYNDFWGTSLTHPNSHKSYRPLTILSFR